MLSFAKLKQHNIDSHKHVNLT